MAAVLVASSFAAREATCADLALDQPVPDLAAQDLLSAQRTLADFPGRATLILFWQPDKERGRQAVCSVADLLRSYEPGALVTVVSGAHPKQGIEQALDACRYKPAVLLDPDRTAFRDFQVVAFPTLFIIGRGRRLIYRIAGFGTEGMGDIQAKLDAIYERSRPHAEALKEPPELIRRFGLARQLLRVGMVSQGEAILEELVKSHPDFRPAWVCLGYRRIAAGRADDALACFDKSQQLDPERRDVAPGLVWIWERKGNRAESEKWARAVNRGDPNAAPAGEICR